mgnify:CR=1 FL=1
MTKPPKFPTIQILGTHENPDGSLDIKIKYEKDWVELVKKDLNKKKVTKKDIKKHFVDMLNRSMNKDDGLRY